MTLPSPALSNSTPTHNPIYKKSTTTFICSSVPAMNHRGCFWAAFYSPTDLRQLLKKLLQTHSCLSVSEKNNEPQSTCKIFTYHPSDTHCINFGNFSNLQMQTGELTVHVLANWKQLYQKSGHVLFSNTKNKSKVSVHSKSLSLVFHSSISSPDGKNFSRFLWDWFLYNITERGQRV